eukprot:GDKI01017662.1.p1 GENE.GDKI01017662.1~~GDKI01017662.1.p1  ORF type:complete len:137 (-),score=58.55 GDKI01017662.1:206-559(-)
MLTHNVGVVGGRGAAGESRGGGGGGKEKRVAPQKDEEQILQTLLCVIDEYQAVRQAEEDECVRAHVDTPVSVEERKRLREERRVRLAVEWRVRAGCVYVPMCVTQCTPEEVQMGLHA